MKVFLFDGSIELLYCAVFEYFETKEKESVSLQVESFFQPSFLDEITLIGFDAQKFERVKQGIEKKVSANWHRYGSHSWYRFVQFFSRSSLCYRRCAYHHNPQLAQHERY